ncbi:MAG TPA: retropepsin-like aspartic protease [Flavisolibacter sp.]|nr:retropepsin-like aspartic protease [Flavisolibacter sp.]
MKEPVMPVSEKPTYGLWADSTHQWSPIRTPDPVSDPVLRSDTPSCVIPFTRAGNLILIKAHVDSIEGNFILDTGAPHLILNITYFRDYPLTQVHDEVQIGSTGAGSAINRTMVNRFSLGTFRYSRAEADLINLGHLENSKGVKILGLIGVNLFKQCEVIIYYEKKLIYLHHIRRKESSSYKSEQLKDEATYSTIPFDLKDNKIITYSEMAGKKLRFVIDCGAETNLLDSRLPDKIFEQVEISGRTTLLGTGNKRVDAITGVLKGLRFANRDIASLPIIITNMEKTCFSLNGCADGVLGFDFLSLQKIGFNFVQRKMYIWK